MVPCNISHARNLASCVSHEERYVSEVLKEKYEAKAVGWTFFVGSIGVAEGGCYFLLFSATFCYFLLFWGSGFFLFFGRGLGFC